MTDKIQLFTLNFQLSKRKICCLLMCGALLLMSACQSSVSEGFWAMDTYMQLDFYGTEAQLDELEAEIERLDALLSTTDENSDVYRLNQNGGAVVDNDTAELAKKSLELCEKLNGALDITVYPIVEEWGFISKNYKIPEQSRLEELLTKVDYRAVTVNGNEISLPDGMKLDFGAVAKGFAADRAMEFLEQKDVKSGILNLGGTVAAFGEKPSGEAWRVGIADPENPSSHIGYVECRDRVVATSGGYERYFKGADGKTYCHIIDPKTGYPADNEIVSVSIVCESGVAADALSTALFVMGLDRAEEYWRGEQNFEFIILDKNNELYITDGIAGGFKLADGYDFKINTVKK